MLRTSLKPLPATLSQFDPFSRRSSHPTLVRVSFMTVGKVTQEIATCARAVPAYRLPLKLLSAVTPSLRVSPKPPLATLVQVVPLPDDQMPAPSLPGFMRVIL